LQDFLFTATTLIREWYSHWTNVGHNQKSNRPHSAKHKLIGIRGKS